MSAADDLPDSLPPVAPVAPGSLGPTPPPPPPPVPPASPDVPASPNGALQPSLPAAPSAGDPVGGVPIPDPPAHDDPSTATFAPLRSDPPPRLFATWWMRYLLFLAQLVALAAVLMREYAVGPGDVVAAPGPVVAYGVSATLLVSWSACSMINARRLVPPTLYQPKSRAWLAVVLWLVAFAAPVGAVRAVEWAQDRFANDPDDLGVVVVTVGAVLVCFLLVWLPFRYHVRQAHRIGAPQRIVGAWFWLPLSSAVGTLAIQAMGLRDSWGEDGPTDWERTLELGVVFGLPALMLALATWRATTVFDEVIDLRWRRWKTEWEQTIEAMVAQPPPGPEMAARSSRG